MYVRRLTTTLTVMHIARSYPRFGRLLAALATSQLGDWLYNLSLLAYVQQRTHSTVWLGVTTAARIAPLVLGAPIGGLIADRLDRRRLMFAADALRAGIMGALVVVAVAGLPVVLVPLLAATATLAGVAYPPSVAAVTPRLVDADQLTAANAARAAIGPVCIAAGPVLGAVLLLIGPPPVAFAINAATFVISGLLVASIPAGAEFARAPRPDHEDATTADGVRALLHDLRQGARALRAAPEAGWMVSADVAGSLVYGSQTVLLLLVASRLHLGAGGYGYLLAAQGVGGIAGATLAGRLGRTAGRRPTLAAALVMVALPLPVLAFTTSAVVAIARRCRRRGRRADRRGRRGHASAADARRVSARVRVRVCLRRVGGWHRARRSDRARAGVHRRPRRGPVPPRRCRPRAGLGHRAARALPLAYEPALSVESSPSR